MFQVIASPLLFSLYTSFYDQIIVIPREEVYTVQNKDYAKSC